MSKPCQSLHCALWEHCTNPLIPVTGSKSPDLLVIGEAPSAEDDSQCGNFLGEAGDLLRTVLVQIGFEPSKIAYTQVVRCRPKQEKYGKVTNREPIPAEVKDCKQFVLADIERLRPRAILLLGAVAFKAVMNQTGIMAKHGSVLDYDNILVVPTFHPANVLRDDTYLGDFVRDLETLYRELYVGKLVIRPTSYTLIKDITGLKKLIIKAADSEECSFDLETSCLNAHNADAQIVCASFSFQECESFIVPLYHKEMIFTGRMLSYAKSIVKEIMESPLPKMAHNAKFDMTWLLVTEGIETVNLTWDTMLMVYLVTEQAGNHGLDACAWRYLPEMGGYDQPLEDYKHHHKDADPKRGGSYRNIPWSILAPYAGMDTDAVIRLKPILEKLL